MEQNIKKELAEDFANAMVISITKVLNLPAEEEEKVRAAALREFKYIIEPYL